MPVGNNHGVIGEADTVIDGDAQSQTKPAPAEDSLDAVTSEDAAFAEWFSKLKLDDDQTFGLTSWFRDHSKNSLIERICQAGYSKLWAENIAAALDNAHYHAEIERPTSWHALGKAVGRDPKGFSVYPRYDAALTARSRSPRLPDALLRYKIAWALGLSEDALSPNVKEWIVSATDLLILKYRRDRLSEVTNKDTQEYAAYMCAQSPVSDGCFSPITIKVICARLATYESRVEAITSILKVAQIVGGILEGHLASEQLT